MKGPHLLNGILVLLTLCPALECRPLLDEGGDRCSVFLKPGEEFSVTLRAEETHNYCIDASSQPLLLTIKNAGIDTAASLRIGQDIRYNLASWRGPRGSYSALLSLQKNQIAYLRILPVEQYSTAGRYHIALVDAQAFSGSRISAETDMMLGSHLHYSYYLGLGDTRKESAKHFRQALASWQALGNQAGAAWAAFELAEVARDLGGSEEARVHLVLAAKLWRVTGNSAAEAAALNVLGLTHWRLAQFEQAMIHLGLAMNISLQANDNYYAAIVENNIGLLQSEMGQFHQAEKRFKSALNRFQGNANLVQSDLMNQTESKIGAALAAVRETGDLVPALSSLSNLAWVYDAIGEPDLAKRLWRNYLVLAPLVSNRIDIGLAANNLGVALLREGSLDQAYLLLTRAEARFREINNTRHLGLSLHNMGQFLAEIGSLNQATAKFNQALEYRSAKNDPKGYSLSQIGLAKIFLEQRRYQEAMAAAQAALNISTQHDDRLRIAKTETFLAHLAYSTGDLQASGEALQRAMRLMEHGAYERAKGQNLLQRGKIELAGQNPRKALITLELAKDLLTKSWDEINLIKTQILLAEAYDLSGRQADALQAASQATDAVERLRQDLANPRFRRSFAAAKRAAYTAHASLLISTGNLAQAFMLSEQSRARGQLDTANLRGVSVDVKPQLLHNRGILKRGIAAKSAALSTDLMADKEDERRILLAEIETMLSDLDQVEAEIRRDPRVADLLASQRFVAPEEIQRQLDAKTVVVEFLLGNSSGLAWWISRDRIITRRLPGTDQLAAKISAVSNAFRTPASLASVAKLARELSTTLLAPLAEFSAVSRLIVVADGPLHKLPFAALPSPISNFASPLIADVEIINAASLTLLRQASATKRGGGRVFVIADPVFSLQDPRVPQSTAAATTEPIELGWRQFKRLPGTVLEAERISEVVGNDKMFLAQGFSANRELITSGQLQQYDVVHFATHGIADLDIPELSGLVLSAVSRSGERIPAFLRSLEISAIRWPADLVVLSGCETGFGPSVNGEGLLSLSRSFLDGGAGNVVASFWRVQDRATATLMGEFYRAYLGQELSVGAALRQAQIEMRSRLETRHPYYWSGWAVYTNTWPSHAQSEIDSTENRYENASPVATERASSSY